MKNEHERDLTPTANDKAISDQVQEHRAAIEKLGRFGIVTWCTDDIVKALQSAGADPSPGNVKAVRQHFYVEQIDDRMTEVGFQILADAIHALGLAVGDAPNKD